jgi:hypothetical protein
MPTPPQESIGLWQFLGSKEITPWLNTISLVSLVPTLAGVYFALRSLKDGRELMQKIGSVSQDLTALQTKTEESVENSMKLAEGLGEVANSLTTHRIGESPLYVDYVTGLVKTARESIEITAILPGIGYFSYPEGWVHLANALQERQQNGVDVSILIGSRGARRADHYVRFADGKRDWESWAAIPKNQMLLQLYCRRYRHSKLTVDSAEEFEQLCLRVDEMIIEDLFSLSHVEFTDDFVPIISWIVDGTNAFFAIGNSKGKNTGFATRDQNIIASLSNLRERYQRSEIDS